MGFQVKLFIYKQSSMNSKSLVNDFVWNKYFEEIKIKKLPFLEMLPKILP